MAAAAAAASEAEPDQISNRVFFEAAKRFQLRSAYSLVNEDQPLPSIRTEWSTTDVNLLGPLVESDLEAAFVVWSCMTHVLAVHDAEAKTIASGSSAPQRHVAAAFLALHGCAAIAPSALLAAAEQFAHAVQQGGGSAPSEGEFMAAAETAVALAFSGYAREASAVIEHMILGVSAWFEENNNNSNRGGRGGSNNNNNSNDDGDDTNPTRFSPEERSLLQNAAHMLRAPFTESAAVHGRWAAAAGKLLKDLKCVISARTNSPGLKSLRLAVVSILFAADGDASALMEAIGMCRCMREGNKTMWFAAAMCSLGKPFATKKAICDYLRLPKQQQQAACGDNWFDGAIVQGLCATTPLALIDAIESIVTQVGNNNTNNSRGSNNSNNNSKSSERRRLIYFMMAAHLEDLCCDLSEPDAMLRRNDAVARYVAELVQHDAQLLSGGVAMAYLLHSPLMDPQFAASLLFLVADREARASGDEEVAVRLYQEKMAASTALQKTLRAGWRRAGPRVDWTLILSTTDAVWEAAYRDLCRTRAMALWDNKDQTSNAVSAASSADGAAAARSSSSSSCCGRCVDAVALLIRSGNCAAAETLLLEALRNFSMSQPLTVQRVVLLGEAAAIGTLQDPVLAAQAQLNNSVARGASDDRILLIQTGGHSLTSLTLCRRVAELFVARSAVNVLDMLLSLVEDPDFVGVAPAGVLAFAVEIAAANIVNIRTLRQHAAVSLLFNSLYGTRKAAMMATSQQKPSLLLHSAESLSVQLVKQMQRLPLDSI